eukprot:m.313552 g.313552  ORF g.313552 m.313552 type:complete len:925 (+) comp16491_c3_seq1:179-2953(+)
MMKTMILFLLTLEAIGIVSAFTDKKKHVYIDCNSGAAASCMRTCSACLDCSLSQNADCTLKCAGQCSSCASYSPCVSDCDDMEKYCDEAYRNCGACYNFDKNASSHLSEYCQNCDDALQLGSAGSACFPYVKCLVTCDSLEAKFCGARCSESNECDKDTECWPFSGCRTSSCEENEAMFNRIREQCGIFCTGSGRDMECESAGCAGSGNFEYCSQALKLLNMSLWDSTCPNQPTPEFIANITVMAAVECSQILNVPNSVQKYFPELDCYKKFYGSLFPYLDDNCPPDIELCDDDTPCDLYGVRCSTRSYGNPCHSQLDYLMANPDFTFDLNAACADVPVEKQPDRYRQHKWHHDFYQMLFTSCQDGDGSAALQNLTNTSLEQCQNYTNDMLLFCKLDCLYDNTSTPYRKCRTGEIERNLQCKENNFVEDCHFALDRLDDCIKIVTRSNTTEIESISSPEIDFKIYLKELHLRHLSCDFLSGAKETCRYWFQQIELASSSCLSPCGPTDLNCAMDTSSCQSTVCSDALEMVDLDQFKHFCSAAIEEDEIERMSTGVKELANFCQLEVALEDKAPRCDHDFMAPPEICPLDCRTPQMTHLSDPFLTMQLPLCLDGQKPYGMLCSQPLVSHDCLAKARALESYCESDSRFAQEDLPIIVQLCEGHEFTTPPQTTTIWWWPTSVDTTTLPIAEASDDDISKGYIISIALGTIFLLVIIGMGLYIVNIHRKFHDREHMLLINSPVGEIRMDDVVENTRRHTRLTPDDRPMRETSLEDTRSTFSKQPSYLQPHAERHDAVQHEPQPQVDPAKQKQLAYYSSVNDGGSDTYASASGVAPTAFAVNEYAMASQDSVHSSAGGKAPAPYDVASRGPIAYATTDASRAVYAQAIRDGTLGASQTDDSSSPYATFSDPQSSEPVVTEDKSGLEEI